MGGSRIYQRDICQSSELGFDGGGRSPGLIPWKGHNYLISKQGGLLGGFYGELLRKDVFYGAPGVYTETVYLILASSTNPIQAFQYVL